MKMIECDGCGKTDKVTDQAPKILTYSVAIGLATVKRGDKAADPQTYDLCPQCSGHLRSKANPKEWPRGEQVGHAMGAATHPAKSTTG